MAYKMGKRPRPQVEDYLRALGYLNLMVWTVVFYLFPPSAFLSQLAELSRLLWLSVAFVGAGMALVGAVMRIDLKLEFPGILLAMIGPLFYALSQFYLSIFPVDVPGDQRVALAVYALLGITMQLPRLIGLLTEKNRLKGLNK